MTQTVADHGGSVNGAGDAHEPVSTLRGAGVQVDGRRVGRALAVAGLVILVALSVTFFAVGAHKNSQINLLRQRGTPIEVTVSSCTGILGGSGSNLAGYACSGSFSFDRHAYRESLPGSAQYNPGALAKVIAAPGDPPLLGTPYAVATERVSARVYVLPAVLGLGAIALAIVLVVTRRASRATSPTRGGRASSAGE